MIDNQHISILFDLIKALYQIDFNEISKELGLKRNDITNYKRGQKKPHINIIRLISEKYPKVNIYLKNENSESYDNIIADPVTSYESKTDKDKIIDHLNNAIEKYEYIIDMQQKLLDHCKNLQLNASTSN